jgi:hypothetical protein
MLKSAAVTREATGGDRSPTPEEIRHQLRSMLASPVFHGSKRCHQFLEYVCEQALAGETGALKERAIAIAVFGRQPHSDLGEDTIVRVGAREVRKRLAQYYITPDGAAARVRIDLPSGAYAPEFSYVARPREDETDAAELAVLPAAPPVPTRDRRKWQFAGIIAVSAAILLAAIGLKLSSANPGAALFQKFWAPVFQSPEPLILAVAHPIVYRPSHRVLQWSADHQPPPEDPTQRPITPPSQMDASDLLPVFNQYVGFGDMVAANEVSLMLALRSKDVRLRMANSVEFADLRNAPAFLIGAITNRWTMELQQSWRFRFARHGVETVIVDTQQVGREWSIAAREDGSLPEDYILVCRIRHSFTGGLAIVAAGLKQFGTEAAGRLLVDSEALGGILRKLPAGWESKNVQFVLHARVIGNTPAQPEVVASHVW